MKTALISDIHGNFEALQTVLADIREQQISRIFCLGDIVGYGPNPRECLDEVIRS
ncbi:MAG: metallophosphoesterase family protein, partial [Pirellulaceae bacterium]